MNIGNIYTGKPTDFIAFLQLFPTHLCDPCFIQGAIAESMKLAEAYHFLGRAHVKSDVHWLGRCCRLMAPN